MADIIRKSWVLILLLVLWSRLVWALPSPEETERLVHQNIIKNFISVANNPKLYIHQQVIAFRNTHRNAQTPEGGIILPIEQSHLQIMTMNSIWDRQQYCMANGECVKESYKRIVLIALPTKVCDATSCIEDKIYFQMKGGIKTACRSQTSNECFDSTILYMPEEAEILLKE